MTMDLSKQHVWSQKREEWFQRRKAALIEHGRASDKNRRVLLDDGIEIKDGQINGPWHVPFLSHSHSLIAYPAPTGRAPIYISSRPLPSR